MKLWMSGEVQVDVGDAFRSARNDVEALVNERIATNDYGDGLRKWVLVPIILKPEFSHDPEVERYSKRTKTAEFRMVVSYAEFSTAHAKEQRRMIFRAIIRSLEIMPAIGVQNTKLDLLLHDVLDSGRAHGLCA